MAILNYTTNVNCERTIAEIQKILVKHGATKITTDYANNIPIAVTFALMVNGTLVGFALPANYDGVLRAMQNDKTISRSKCNKEHATNVSWRIIKDWVEAQMAIVEANLAEMAEVFLPYAVTNSGSTLYKEIIQSNGMKMLQSPS